MQFDCEFIFKKFGYGRQKFLQILFVLSDYGEIICVADIAFYLQSMLHKLIKLVHVNIGEKLGGQIPYGNASPRRALIAPHNGFQKPQRIIISDAFFDYGKENFVIHAVKKLFNVTFQGKTAIRIVLARIHNHLLENVHPLMGAKSHPAGKRGWNEGRLEDRVHDRKDRVVKNSIQNRCLVNMSLFRVMNPKSAIRTVSVRFALQIPVQLKNILLQNPFKLENIGPFPFVIFKHIPSRKEIFGRDDLFKNVSMNFHKL